MKKTLLVSIAVVLIFSMKLFSEQTEQKVAYAYTVVSFPFYVYQDATSKINNMVLTGWAGDYRNLKINSRWKEEETADNSCIKLSFIPKHDSKMGYAGIAFQQNAENRWGSIRGGYDLSRAKKIFLFARGERGGEQVEFGMRKKNRNEMSRSIGLVELTKDWKLYEIDLEGLTFNDIAGGLYVLVHSKNGVYSATVYLDEVYYSIDTKPIYTVLPKRAGKSKS